MRDEMHVEQEVYTHEYLWRSGGKLLEKAEAEEEGSYHYLLPSLLMSFLAYEAFINFCGYVLLPELWTDEKKKFKNKGIEAKLEAIVARLENFSWEKGQPPYQSLKKLESFRNSVAHGKVQYKAYVTERKEKGTHYDFECSWDDHISSVEDVKEARANIKAFCSSLLIAVRKISDHLHLLHDAFEGPLASGSGTSRLS